MISYKPIKIEEQTATKIDFHCSLESQGNFSVNETVNFWDIIVMGIKVELLLLFISNKYIMLADICKVFS